ncbi:type I-E CRISPR-associated protein Cse2/CasB [Nitrosococcus watsonii]|uniref:CRISPR-associated protein, Cse2 family n=1 Tax=Nitrosococcus watsoni (strain C-113) TaxID=105559 RepID=D8K5Z0_NITWC|nr:type I-E CRISPR-associated protein Cse2/CasB [Nitrosococcus watsonii]ADJ28317.1 CRISPR-associated protein, Cse2 family [Nitrosococcus watsonii C-113]
MSTSIDFAALRFRYEQLANGPRAELRRVRSPEGLASIPGFYRLLPGQRASEKWLRVAFCLPWLKHAHEALPLGAQLAKHRIHEQRLFQVIRSTSPNDLLQLRRLLQQVEPTVNWQRFGWQLYFWRPEDKRRLLEEFYLVHSGESAA